MANLFRGSKKDKDREIQYKLEEKMGQKYGRQLKGGHESQLKGPPKNAITTQLQKVLRTET